MICQRNANILWNSFNDEVKLSIYAEQKKLIEKAEEEERLRKEKEEKRIKEEAEKKATVEKEAHDASQEADSKETVPPVQEDESKVGILFYVFVAFLTTFCCVDYTNLSLNMYPFSVTLNI